MFPQYPYADQGSTYGNVGNNGGYNNRSAVTHSGTLTHRNTTGYRIVIFVRCRMDTTGNISDRYAFA